MNFLPFFNNVTSRCSPDAVSWLLASLSVHTNTPPTNHVLSRALSVSSWHWCLVLYFSLFFFLSLSPHPVFWKLVDECFTGEEWGTQIGTVISPPGWWYYQCTTNHSSLLCSEMWLSELTGRAKTWAYPRLPTNTLLYYTILPAPYPPLALVDLGIYEIFCFAGTENLRLLLNLSMSEHTAGTRYPRNRPRHWFHPKSGFALQVLLCS